MTFEEMILLPENEQKELFKKLKDIRHTSKTVNYSALYGVGVATLARSMGVKQSFAKKVLEAYKRRNWAVEKVSKSVTIKRVRNKNWLFNPVSGFYYELRAQKDTFSTLNQGTGVYCFDTWVKEVRNVRKQITAQCHDEIILQISKGYREECTKLLKNAIDRVNDMLKLNIKLEISVHYGDNYAEIH